MKRKVLATILTVAMGAGVLAGCGDKKQEETQTKETEKGGGACRGRRESRRSKV